jgi:hypothetical protein
MTIPIRTITAAKATIEDINGDIEKAFGLNVGSFLTMKELLP